MSNRDDRESALPLPLLHAKGACVYDEQGNMVAAVTVDAFWGITNIEWQLACDRAAADIAAACNGYPVMQKALQNIMHHLGAAASVTTDTTTAAWLRDLAATAASTLDACTNKETP